ncbi:MAG: four helix bundle protein [Planctomycetes bacterium]|nr:four helix bundle protein [Planctomycetota bacterium]
MTAPSPQQDIRIRTFRFAVRSVKLANALGNSVAGAVLARHVIRAGTSVGANVEEAQASQSRREFARRLNIAYAEAREVHYWLRLLKESEMVVAKRLDPLIAEADEIVRILRASVRCSRRGAGNS